MKTDLIVIIVILIINSFSNFIHFKSKEKWFRITRIGINVLCLIYFSFSYGIIFGPFNILLILGGIALSFLQVLIYSVIFNKNFKINDLILLPSSRNESRKPFFKRHIHNIINSSYEECIYHLAFQSAVYLLSSSIICSIIGSVGFFTINHSKSRKNVIGLMDLALFFIIASILYAITWSLYLTIAMHIVRNCFIINLQFNYNGNSRKERYLNIISEKMMNYR